MEKLNPTKHIRYLSYYKANDYYWGIGIENETYFQFDEPNFLRERAIYESHKPERYSVDYFIGLDSKYKDLLKQLFREGTHAIPLYMNSHSFQKTDIKGNHSTIYENEPKPNPSFSGETLHQTLCKVNPSVFKDKYTINYVFDGDTHFINASVLNEQYRYSNKPLTIEWNPTTNEIEFL